MKYIFLGLASPLVLLISSVVEAQVKSQREALTVRIEAKVGERLISHGTGTIVGRSGNTYRVLTAAHVVNRSSVRYFVHTFDGSLYPVSSPVSRAVGDVDLATLDFKSDKTYETVRIADKDPNQTENITVCGFPRPGEAIRSFVFQCVPGQVTGWNDVTPKNEGYYLIYNVVTRGGMSGGPVFNQDNLLSGVHGKADGDCIGDRCDKNGFNLGIPVSVIRKFTKELGLELKQAGPVSPVRTYVPQTPSSNSDVCPAGPGRC